LFPSLTAHRLHRLDDFVERRTLADLPPRHIAPPSLKMRTAETIPLRNLRGTPQLSYLRGKHVKVISDPFGACCDQTSSQSHALELTRTAPRGGQGVWVFSLM
jgi:hypothetical protein